jgi:hypothetical protein
MTREERCKLAIERGFTYDSETGLIYNRFGKIVGRNNYGYIKIALYLNKKQYNLRAHQFAWYWVNKEYVEEIDHINGIRDDNRICNLRSVTRQQNQWNRTTAKGYYKQIYKDSIYYIAQISINTKPIYLGSYNSEEEARNAYLAAKQIYHVI